MNNIVTIDEYLDDLLGRLTVEPRRTRRILAEAEDHLRESADEFERAGMPRHDAESRAIDRFGSPGEVATRFNHGPLDGGLAPLLGELAMALLPVATVGFLVIAASGLVALAFGEWLGPAFVAGDTPGVQFAAGRCGDIATRDCVDAILLHAYDETINYRIAMAVPGTALAVLLLAARWRGWHRRGRRLPASFGATVATSIFAVAGGGLLLIAASELTWDGTDDGAGAFLSAGLAAFAAAVVYGGLLARSLAQPKARETP